MLVLWLEADDFSSQHIIKRHRQQGMNNAHTTDGQTFLISYHFAYQQGARSIDLIDPVDLRWLTEWLMTYTRDLSARLAQRMTGSDETIVAQKAIKSSM